MQGEDASIVAGAVSSSLVISIAILSFNTLSDRRRDSLDQRLQHQEGSIRKEPT